MASDILLECTPKLNTQDKYYSERHIIYIFVFIFTLTFLCLFPPFIFFSLASEIVDLQML